MLRFVVLSAILVAAQATSYGNYGNSYGSQGSSYGSGNSGYGSGYSTGYAAALPTYTKVVGVASQGYSNGGGYSGGQVVNAAVQSRHNVQFYDVPSSYSAPNPVTVDVPTNSQPLNFVFRSQSSPINVESSHESSPGSYKETQSQDEPHVSVHTVTRPVVQELREVITPFRRIKQEVQPVQEEVQTLVARGQGYTGGATYGSGATYGTGATYANNGANYGTGYGAGLVLTTADLGTGSSNYGTGYGSSGNGYSTGYTSGYGNKY